MMTLIVLLLQYNHIRWQTLISLCICSVHFVWGKCQQKVSNDLRKTAGVYFRGRQFAGESLCFKRLSSQWPKPNDLTWHLRLVIKMYQTIFLFRLLLMRDDKSYFEINNTWYQNHIISPNSLMSLCHFFIKRHLKINTSAGGGCNDVSSVNSYYCRRFVIHRISICILYDPEFTLFMFAGVLQRQPGKNGSTILLIYRRIIYEQYNFILFSI